MLSGDRCCVPVSAGDCPLCPLRTLSYLACAGTDANPSAETLHNRGLLWLCQELTKDIRVPTGTYMLPYARILQITLNNLYSIISYPRFSLSHLY